MVLRPHSLLILVGPVEDRVDLAPKLTRSDLGRLHQIRQRQLVRHDQDVHIAPGLLLAPGEGSEYEGLLYARCQRIESRTQHIGQAHRLGDQTLEFVEYWALGVRLVEDVYSKLTAAHDASGR